MSTEETIAMNVAQQLAPEVGNDLLRAVKVQIAKARGEESAYRGVDANQMAALAGVVISAASLVWSIILGQRQLKQAAAAQPKPDRATQKRAIIERLDKTLNHIAGLDGDLRERMLSAVVEEALAEADRGGQGAASVRA